MMYKRGVISGISMALATIDRDQPQAPMGILAPKTWSDLRMIHVVIDQHFPFAREAALKRECHERMREIQETIWAACCTEQDGRSELPPTLRSDATEMLKLMDILEPEKVPTSTQGVTGAVASFAKRVRSLMF